MEKRSSEHYKTGTKYKGKLILADSLTIRDISLEGVQLLIMEDLVPETECRIEISSSSDEKITPLCKVVWSSLMRTEERNGKTLSTYGAGLEFIDLSEDEKELLEKNIKELAEE